MHPRLARCASLVVVFGVVAACASAPGEPCEASGEGFSRRDSCGADGRCLAFPIACPDGSTPTPNVCEGAECAGDGDCADDEVCAGTGSVTRNCVAAAVCAP